jgi:hypothetical protein
MREVLEAAGKRVGKRKECLDASVVGALVKLWGWSEEGGSIPEWKDGGGRCGHTGEADRGGKDWFLGGGRCGMECLSAAGSSYYEQPG